MVVDVFVMLALSVGEEFYSMFLKAQYFNNKITKYWQLRELSNLHGNYRQNIPQERKLGLSPEWTSGL